MTVPIQIAPISPERVVGGFSRYLKQRVIYWGDENLLTFDTYIRKPYVPTGNEKIQVITKGVEFRPDLVSYDVYGMVDAWWRILEANGMHDITDFVTGTTIILPDIGDL